MSIEFFFFFSNLIGITNLEWFISLCRAGLGISSARLWAWATPTMGQPQKKKKKKKVYCSLLQMAGSTKKKMMKEVGEKQAKERG